MRPGVRIHDGLNGVSASQCAVALMFGNAYGIASDWWMLPGNAASFGRPASSAATSVTSIPFGRSGMKTSDSHADHVAVRVERGRDARAASAAPSGPSRARRRGSIARARACRVPPAIKRGVGGGILVAVAAVAAGALDVDAAHVFRLHREHVRELPAQQVRLPARPPARSACRPCNPRSRTMGRSSRGCGSRNRRSRTVSSRRSSSPPPCCRRSATTSSFITLVLRT